MPPEFCPNCGAEIPRKAKACPGCGADENCGWAGDSRQASSADLGLPEEDFNYNEFTRREFGRPSPKPAGLHWAWWVTGIVLLVAIVLFWVL